MANSMIGVVTSAGRQKTIRVEVPRTVRHPKYGKYLRRRTVCHAHDEREQAGVGDTVEIASARPLSKTKRWNLVRVVARAASAEVPASNEAVTG
jgi:small subunit ribosomal protein S17